MQNCQPVLQQTGMQSGGISPAFRPSPEDLHASSESHDAELLLSSALCAICLSVLELRHLKSG